MNIIVVITMSFLTNVAMICWPFQQCKMLLSHQAEIQSPSSQVGLAKVCGRRPVHIPIVNVGVFAVTLHPCCPLGFLTKTVVVSLPTGIIEV